jgi:hypothetical protein
LVGERLEGDRLDVHGCCLVDLWSIIERFGGIEKRRRKGLEICSWNKSRMEGAER